MESRVKRFRSRPSNLWNPSLQIPVSAGEQYKFSGYKLNFISYKFPFQTVCCQNDGIGLPTSSSSLTEMSRSPYKLCCECPIRISEVITKTCDWNPFCHNFRTAQLSKRAVHQSLRLTLNSQFRTMLVKTTSQLIANCRFPTLHEWLSMNLGWTCKVFYVNVKFVSLVGKVR
jgi:hypothetical protein